MTNGLGTIYAYIYPLKKENNKTDWGGEKLRESTKSWYTCGALFQHKSLNQWVLIQLCISTTHFKTSLMWDSTLKCAHNKSLTHMWVSTPPFAQESLTQSRVAPNARPIKATCCNCPNVSGPRHLWNMKMNHKF